MRPPDRLLVLLGLGLAALRALYVAGSLSFSPALSQPLADSLFYVHEARRIAGGAFLADAPFYRAPLYPYLFYARIPAYFRAAKAMFAALAQETKRVPAALRALLNRRVASWNGCEF